MVRTIDITDKLTFEGNPSLVIKGKQLEVNADAPTMLKVMGILGDDNPSMNEILTAYDLIFPEESKKNIEKMSIGFQDLIIVIQGAVQLITGDKSLGEQ